MKYHMYIKSYDRFDTSFRKTKVTEAQLCQAKKLVHDDDDEGQEKFMLKYDAGGILLAAFNGDNEQFSLKKLMKGKRQSIWLEEEVAGIGVTLDEAKLACLECEAE